MRDEILVTGALRDVWRRGHRTADQRTDAPVGTRAMADLVAEHVLGDGQQPGGEAGIPAEPLQVLAGPDPGFLDHVVRAVLVEHEAPGQGAYEVGMGQQGLGFQRHSCILRGIYLQSTQSWMSPHSHVCIKIIVLNFVTLLHCFLQKSLCYNLK